MMKKRTKLLTMILALTSFATLSFSSCDMVNDLLNKIPGFGVEAPGDETPGDETPGDETPGDETPGDETPGDETPQTPTLQLDVEEISVYVEGRNSVTATVMVGTEVQTGVQFTYTFDDETVAKYEDGSVVGLAFGETVMTVSATVNGQELSATCSIIFIDGVITQQDCFDGIFEFNGWEAQEW